MINGQKTITHSRIWGGWEWLSGSIQLFISLTRGLHWVRVTLIKG